MKNKEMIEVSKQMDAYIRGNLSRREIDELWLQFLENPYYYQLFETELHLRNLIQKRGHSRGLFIGKWKRKTGMTYWIMAAAATVFIVLSFYLNISGTAPALDTFAISTISYNEMAAGNVERSEEDYVKNIETDMNRAMAAAYVFKVTESMDMFNELMSSAVNESQRTRIEFNLAILHYNRSEYELAKESFLTVINSNDIDEIYSERAWWFLANTYLKMNDQERAMKAILMVQLLNGNNREAASTLLNTLKKRES